MSWISRILSSITARLAAEKKNEEVLVRKSAEKVAGALNPATGDKACPTGHIRRNTRQWANGAVQKFRRRKAVSRALAGQL